MTALDVVLTSVLHADRPETDEQATWTWNVIGHCSQCELSHHSISDTESAIARGIWVAHARHPVCDHVVMYRRAF